MVAGLRRTPPLSSNTTCSRPQEIEKLFAELDTNKDDVIQLEEWLDGALEGGKPAHTQACSYAQAHARTHACMFCTGVDQEVLDRLNKHASAETWRRQALGRGFAEP